MEKVFSWTKIAFIPLAVLASAYPRPRRRSGGHHRHEHSGRDARRRGPDHPGRGLRDRQDRLRGCGKHGSPTRGRHQHSNRHDHFGRVDRRGYLLRLDRLHDAMNLLDGKFAMSAIRLPLGTIVLAIGTLAFSARGKPVRRGHHPGSNRFRTDAPGRSRSGAAARTTTRQRPVRRRPTRFRSIRTWRS